MGSKHKTGKHRKDKFYRLAKETGFRSRAAFKLIQLNRKFEFLQKSRVCIDLCAAPGGWMQVAKQTMPVSSIVVGIDIVPIKTVPGCINLQEDITTDKCRVALQQALQTWKADVVLNDGAPNVGKNWLFDSYQQACLTLSALKLATRFLRQGGWFVTKVFRSKDYNPLLWVFKQLFKKVHSTKPQASRNESAEIFVVCQHYLAPDKLDARFLDPKHVFEDVQLDPSAQINQFHPERAKKAKAEGYAEGVNILHNPITVSEFLASSDGIASLQKATAIVLDDEVVVNHPRTTSEVKECCKDIRVLGRKDLRMLLAWWKALRDEKKPPEVEIKEGNVEVTEAELNADEDEEGNLDSKVIQLEKEESQEVRRKRKQTNKARRKLQTQMDLKMVVKGDAGPTLLEKDLFKLTNIRDEEGLQKVVDQIPDVVAESDPDSDVELPPNVVKYSTDGSEHLHSSGMYYTAEESETEEDQDSLAEDSPPKEGLGLEEEEEEVDGEEEKVDDDYDNGNIAVNDALRQKKKAVNPLITDLDYRNVHEKRLQTAELWFQKDAFKDLEFDDDIDDELEKIKGKILGQKSEDLKAKVYDQKCANGRERTNKKGQKRNLSDEDEFHDMGEVKKKGDSKSLINNPQKDGFEVVSVEPVKTKPVKLDAQSLAIGTMMVASKKSKRDLIDAGWNRYAFNDEQGLPSWFVEDEERNMRKEIPVPPALLQEYKKQHEELDVRPIKKVVEAKARKKKRTLRRLEKAKKKVEAVMENIDISDKEKARQVKQLYKKAKGGKKPEVTYVVAKKHLSGKRMMRPRGVAGPYKVVDPRMKKDDRRHKISAKSKGKKAKGGRKTSQQRAGRGSKNNKRESRK